MGTTGVETKPRHTLSESTAYGVSASALEEGLEGGTYEFMGKGVFLQHKKLCQERLQTSGDWLWCRYEHYQQPHLRIQPFKLEELQVDPPVLRFYDVITDKEIDELISESSPKMKRSGTKSFTGETIFTNERLSHNAWLATRRSKVKDTLTQRISDMTRLNAYAERYQVFQYSIAGEYLIHMDYLRSTGVSFESDRIATVMFYLNDVKEGGNTVFINWDLAVPPVKNSALLWFNFKRNGEIDKSSVHSGCPVLKGTKWVLNKWINNGGQEFVIPCGLHRDASFKDFYF